MIALAARPSLRIADRWRDYALLDSGDQKKLERFGDFRFIRPEPQALWRPQSAIADWAADGEFEAGSDEVASRWKASPRVPGQWRLGYDGLPFWARCTPFRHLGFFPEQAIHWDAIVNAITAGPHPFRLLNLFGYTGLASLLAARAGAEITHVDASPKAIAFARENQALAELDAASIRWIVDDALKFVEREGRRGKTYHAILLDPPKHGRGPKGETWKLEEMLPDLLRACAALLAEDAAAIIVTVYAVRLSCLALANALADALAGRAGAIDHGEMALQEAPSGRLLPTAIYADWRPR